MDQIGGKKTLSFSFLLWFFIFKFLVNEIKKPFSIFFVFCGNFINFRLSIFKSTTHSHKVQTMHHKEKNSKNALCPAKGLNELQYSFPVDFGHFMCFYEASYIKASIHSKSMVNS